MRTTLSEARSSTAEGSFVFVVILGTWRNIRRGWSNWKIPSLGRVVFHISTGHEHVYVRAPVRLCLNDGWNQIRWLVSSEQENNVITLNEAEKHTATCSATAALIPSSRRPRRWYLLFSSLQCRVSTDVAIPLLAVMCALHHHGPYSRHLFSPFLLPSFYFCTYYTFYISAVSRSSSFLPDNEITENECQSQPRWNSPSCLSKLIVLASRDDESEQKTNVTSAVRKLRSSIVAAVGSSDEDVCSSLSTQQSASCCCGARRVVSTFNLALTIFFRCNYRHIACIFDPFNSLLFLLQLLSAVHAGSWEVKGVFVYLRSRPNGVHAWIYNCTYRNFTNKMQSSIPCIFQASSLNFGLHWHYISSTSQRY